MHKHITFRRIALPVALAAVGAVTLGAASPALAAGPEGLAEVNGSRVEYTAASGQANDVTVTMSKLITSGTQMFYDYTIDDVYDIIAGGGCSHPTADLTRVVCTVEVFDTPSPHNSGYFDLLDRGDTVKFVNESDQGFDYNEFWVGSGDDSIVTRQPDGTVDGSAIWGGPGADTIVAGPGGDNNMVSGGTGNDVIHVTDYANGGAGNDTLYASGSASLAGGTGNDKLYGGTGSDTLRGNEGNDWIWGKQGNDSIYGNSGNDHLYGGPGTDTISGGPGRDVIRHN